MRMNLDREIILVWNECGENEFWKINKFILSRFQIITVTLKVYNFLLLWTQKYKHETKAWLIKYGPYCMVIRNCDPLYNLKRAPEPTHITMIFKQVNSLDFFAENLVDSTEKHIRSESAIFNVRLFSTTSWR